MGCAFISQKSSIKTKEVDMHLENAIHYYKETNDLSNDKQKTNEENCEIKNVYYKNVQKITVTNKINDPKTFVNNNKEEVYASGPIINMLKRQVDNFKKLNNNKDNIFCKK